MIFGVRFASATDNPLTRKLNRGIALEYVTLADALKQRGITDGTLLTAVVRDSGNLRALLPDLRIGALDSFRTERPVRRPSDEKSCVAVLREGQEEFIKALAPGQSPRLERIQTGNVTSGVIAKQQIVWFIARLDPKSPACR